MTTFIAGMYVYIKGRKTVLQFPLDGEYSGGWKVEPAVDQCHYWNEGDITPEPEGETLVRRLYDNDEANALTNEAARFIERMLKDG